MAAGDSSQTLIVTTRSGVRPLGVRGAPLHNAAAQLRRVIRRRLGDDAAILLADPQLHDDGSAIDWYADAAGEVRAVVDLEPTRRTAILADVDRTLESIRQLGVTLGSASSGDDAPHDTGVIGRSLQLAARRPAESFVFLVGERPVVVCWGYEKEAAASLLPATLPRPPAPAPKTAHNSVLPEATPAARPAALPVPLPAAGIPWARTLLAALPLLLLLLGAAWLLRDLLPAQPELALATREAATAPTAPTPPQADRLPILKASLSGEQARAKALQLELAATEAEMKKRIADCRPPDPPRVDPPKIDPPRVEAPKPKPEPPKPPQTATAQPPKAPNQTPPPQQQPRNPNDNRLRLPSQPSNDYSFLQGCWRTDPFRHERLQTQAGVSSYCFDAGGRGALEWRRGRTACRTRAVARFEGDILRLRDADTSCNDGSQWYADSLVCQRGADNVAQCSGSSRNAYGSAVTWTVNLHKLD
jgi:hypothetical protein